MSNRSEIVRLIKEAHPSFRRDERGYCIIDNNGKNVIRELLRKGYRMSVIADALDCDQGVISNERKWLWENERFDYYSNLGT